MPPHGRASTTCCIFIASITSTCLAGAHGGALLDAERDDGALHRRPHGTVPSGPASASSARRRCRLRCRGLAVKRDTERIAGRRACAGAWRCGGSLPLAFEIARAVRLGRDQRADIVVDETRVYMRPQRRSRMRRAARAGTGCSSARRRCGTRRARDRPCARRRRSVGRRSARSPSRAASRSAGWCGSPRSRTVDAHARAGRRLEGGRACRRRRRDRAVGLHGLHVDAQPGWR